MTDALLDIQPPISDATAHEFATALLQLLEARSYDEVSVTDISQRAGYSRKTFYKHFESKAHLINWALYVQYRSRSENSTDRARSLRALAEVAADNPSFFAATIRENASPSSPGNYFSRLLFAGIYTSMADELFAKLEDDDEVDACIGAACELLRTRMLAWLEGEHAGNVEWFLRSTKTMVETLVSMLSGDIMGTSSGNTGQGDNQRTVSIAP